MSIWTRHSDDRFNRPQGADLPYLTRAQNRRRELVRQCRMLYTGEDREYWLNEQRSEYDFPKIRVRGSLVEFYRPFNLLSVVVDSGTELLMGESPLIQVDDEMQKAEADAMLERTSAHTAFAAAVATACWAGDAALEIGAWEGGATIIDLPASSVYPVGPMQPDRQYAAYVRFDRAMVGTPDNPEPTTSLVLKTEYAAGTIKRTCYLGDLAGALVREVDIELWPNRQANGNALALEEKTGLDRPSIVWVTNRLFEGRAVSDFDGLLELQDDVHSEHTRLQRILLKHADPKIFFVDSTAPAGEFSLKDDAYVGTTPDSKPSYIEPPGNIEAAAANRKFVIQAFCSKAQMSPVWVSMKEGGVPDSARKLRLEMTPDMAKARAKVPVIRPAIKLAVELARRMHRTLTRPLSGENKPASVEIRDGLPDDTYDVAETISMLRAATVISLKRSLEMQGLGPAAVATEMKLLAEEARTGTPSMLVDGRSEVALEDRQSQRTEEDPAGVPTGQQDVTNAA